MSGNKDKKRYEKINDLQTELFYQEAELYETKDDCEDPELLEISNSIYNFIGDLETLKKQKAR